MTEKTSELVNLRLEGEALEALLTIQSIKGGSKAGAVRHALVLYSTVLDTLKAGKTVTIGDKEVILL